MKPPSPFPVKEFGFHFALCDFHIQCKTPSAERNPQLKKQLVGRVKTDAKIIHLSIIASPIYRNTPA